MFVLCCSPCFTPPTRPSCHFVVQTDRQGVNCLLSGRMGELLRVELLAFGDAALGVEGCRSSFPLGANI